MVKDSKPMKRAARLLIILWWLPMALSAGDSVPSDYVWTTPSRNSSESMPCGGHDIGMNIWVEDGDIPVVETERLSEVLTFPWVAVEMESPSSGFQKSVVFIKPTALGDIYQDVAVLHPDVHTDVMTTAGHRLAGVLARRSPYIIAGHIVGCLSHNHVK